MTEFNKTVLVDMDGVLASFDGSAIAHLSPDEIVPRTNFYITDDYPVEIRPSIEAVYNAPGFFENLQPMPGVLEAWQTMVDNGYEPRIASAPLSSNRTSVEGKIKWLDRIMVPEFGVKIVEDAIIDANKWAYPGLALIDDRPEVSTGPDGQNVAEWKQILFGWPHLENVPLAKTAFRLFRWEDTDTLLSTLALIEEERLRDRS